MKKEVDNIMMSELDKNSLIKINGIYLKKWYLDILQMYDINHFTSLDDLIFQIEEVLFSVDDEELETISIELTERNYYENTNK